MKREFLFSAMFILLSVFFLMCGNSSSNDSTSRTYLGTQSRGDVWSWTIDTSGGTGTFSATNEEVGYDYSGTVETLASGYLKLTVTTSNEPGFTPPIEAYALEYPNTVLVVSVEDDDNGVIVCVASGNCPTENATYNWVKTTIDPHVEATDEAYGVSTSAISGSDISFTHTQYILDGSPYGTPATETGFTCSDGKITNTDPVNDMVVAMTPSGAFIGDNGSGEGGIIGMEAPASNISISDVCLSGREFRGVLFEPEGSPGDTKPMWLRSNNTATQLIGGEYEDPFEDGFEKPAGTTITFDETTQTSSGIINATATHSPDPIDVVFMINKINGRYFLYGAYLTEENTTTGDYYLGNFLMMEQ